MNHGMNHGTNHRATHHPRHDVVDDKWPDRGHACMHSVVKVEMGTWRTKCARGASKGG